jgi:hypothetical protein
VPRTAEVHYLISFTGASSLPEKSPELCDEKSSGCTLALDFSREGLLLLLRK